MICIGDYLLQQDAKKSAAAELCGSGSGMIEESLWKALYSCLVKILGPPGADDPI